MIIEGEGMPLHNYASNAGKLFIEFNIKIFYYADL